jgi:tetratricopeptide (TPR) repeat protein
MPTEKLKVKRGKKMRSRSREKLLLMFALLAMFLVCGIAAQAQDTNPATDGEAGTAMSQQEFDEAVWWLIDEAKEINLPAGETAVARNTALMLQEFELSPEALAETYYILAAAAAYEGDFVSAQAEYAAMGACEASEKSVAEGWSGYIYTLMALESYEQATAECEAMIAAVSSAAAFPESAEYCAGARYQISDMLYRQERFAEALAQYNLLLEEYPQSSWTPLAQKQANEIEAFLANTTEGGA